MFFAGHGVEIGGLNFLLPADMPRVASGEEEVLKASGLSLSSFLDQARERKPQTMLYVVDACRDNPFVNANGRSIGGTRGLTLVESPSGTFVMFSAGAGETALDRLSDDDPNPNSVYTRTLLPRLKAPGRIGDIARDVRRDVRELASHVNHVQTPTRSSATFVRRDALWRPRPTRQLQSNRNSRRHRTRHSRLETRPTTPRASTCSRPISPNTATPF